MQKGEIDDIDIDIGGSPKGQVEQEKEKSDQDKKSELVESDNDKEEEKQEDDDDPFHTKRGRLLDEKVMVKICDMGNGCWTYHHFTPEIQTRQYRSPEVIIGADYNTSADVWSFACTIFEMVTGDFLFEPRKGQNYDKDDDHLAQMMELLGRMPKNLALSGKNSKKFFDSRGHLRRISGLNYWPLKKVLIEKYRIKEDEAHALADFLLPMLTWNHETRATAQQMLSHPWLNMKDNYDFKYTDREYDVMMLKKELKNQVKGGAAQNDDLALDEKQEMNELIESDPDLYAADNEKETKKKRNLSVELEEELFNESEISLEDPEEFRIAYALRKDQENKIHNSFTGPYPQDPSDFGHNDKGENTQF
jgi:serine/threonine-protein kinase SRPK3